MSTRILTFGEAAVGTWNDQKYGQYSVSTPGEEEVGLKRSRDRVEPPTRSPAAEAQMGAPAVVANDATGSLVITFI